MPSAGRGCAKITDAPQDVLAKKHRPRSLRYTYVNNEQKRRIFTFAALAWICVVSGLAGVVAALEKFNSVRSIAGIAMFIAASLLTADFWIDRTFPTYSFQKVNIVPKGPDLGQRFETLAGDISRTAGELRELLALVEAEQAKAAEAAAEARRQTEAAAANREIAEQQQKAVEAVDTVLAARMDRAIKIFERQTRRSRIVGLLYGGVIGAVLGVLGQAGWDEVFK